MYGSIAHKLIFFAFRRYEIPNQWIQIVECKIPSTCIAPFDFNYQQDVAEILQIVFGEVKLKSIRTDDLLSNALRTSITCNSCFCSTVREEKLYIVSVPMADNVSSSQRNFFHLSCCPSHIFCKKKASKIL